LWNWEVQEATRVKKEAFKKWFASKNVDDNQLYKKMKSAAKGRGRRQGEN